MEKRVLKRLPSDVQSRLRSDVAITSIAQCVEELVLNSLDAGSVCLAVRIDLTTFTVQVVDNGAGISQHDLKLIGERYSTSKCQKLSDLYNLEYFGFRGEALASLRDVSTALEIHSRCRQSCMTYCKLFNHGKSVPVAESKYPRLCPGTTITIHNLFYNLPVRQKNIFPALELEQTRYRIEGIALINPSISFSLRNDATGHVLLQTQKSNSVLTAFMYLFGGNLSKHLKHVAIDKEPFHIEGYVGKDGYNKKLLQFVYVNYRLVLKTQVHKVVNKVMANCTQFRRKPSKDVKNSVSTTPPRCMEKHPMFVINIRCPLNIYDITYDPKKTLVEFKDWETLTSAVETMVTDFLKSENLWYYSETDLKKTLDSSSPMEPTIKKKKYSQKGETEPQMSNESEISTLNTSNSLFSKIVFRKPPEISDLKTPSPPMVEIAQTPSPPMVEISTPVQTKKVGDKTPTSKDSCSAEAVKEFANRLYIDFYPEPGDVASDDELPIAEHTKKSNQCNATVSWSKTSSIGSEDTLQEEPLLSLLKTNKRVPQPPPQRVYDPKPDVISLPSEGAIISTLDILRSKEVVNGEKNLTAAQKISLRLKERIKISLPESEPESKVSRVLKKFRKISSQNVVDIIIEKHNEIRGNSEIWRSKSTVQKDAGDGPDRKNDKSELPEMDALNISNNNNESKSNSCSQHLERKRTNLNLEVAPIPNQSKKSKFMTSESFVMTPRTALVEVLPLLQKAKRQSKKTKDATNHKDSLPVSKQPRHISNQSIADAFLDRTFKKPHPIDHSRRYHSSKFSPYGRPCGAKGSSRNLHSSQSKIIEDVDTTKEHSEKFIDSTQGFNVNVPSSNHGGMYPSGAIHTSPEPVQESQGFSFNFSSTDCDGPSEKVSPGNTQRSSKITASPATPDNPFTPTLPFEYSADNSDEHSQLTPVSINFCPSINEPSNNLQTTDHQRNINSQEACLPGSADDKISDILQASLHPKRLTDHQKRISPQMNSEQLTIPSSSENETSDTFQMEHSQNSFTDVQISIISQTDSEQIAVTPSSSDNKTSDMLLSPNRQNSNDPQTSTSTLMDTDQISLKDQLPNSGYTPETTSTFLSTMEYIVVPSDNGTIEESQPICPETQSLSKTKRNLEISANSISQDNSRAKPESEIEGDVKDGEIDSSFQCGQKYNSKSDEKPYTDSYSITDLLSDSSQAALENSASSLIHASSHNQLTGNEISESNMAKKSEKSQMDTQESNKIFGKDQSQLDTQESNNCMLKSHLEAKIHESNMLEEENEDKDGAPESCNDGTRDIWVEMKDKNSGKVIHVNQLTGNTVYEKEWTLLQQKFDKPGFNNSESILSSNKTTSTSNSNISTLCTNDTNQLYGMLLNHLDTDQEEYSIKWRTKTNTDNDTGSSVIDDMFNQWQNPVHEKSHQCGINTEVNHSSRSAVTSYQSLNQITFTKDMLSCMQVLGQVDSKFIACLISSTTQSQNKVMVPDLLVMLDQHAAHERVRLEQYISELFIEDEEGSERVKQSEITPPLSLTLRQEDVRLMISFKNEFTRIGIKFNGVEDNRNEIKINSVPACIAEREANELKRGKNSIATQFVEELITEHVEYLKNTSGSRRRLPLALQRILATKACRGAIKFNDNLSPAQCKELITALSKCDLPFQCAHGRPSVIPLFKLDKKLYQHTQVKPKPRLDRLIKGRPKQK